MFCFKMQNLYGKGPNKLCIHDFYKKGTILPVYYFFQNLFMKKTSSCLSKIKLFRVINCKNKCIFNVTKSNLIYKISNSPIVK